MLCGYCVFHCYKHTRERKPVLRNELSILSKLKPILNRFKKDEDGAALIEYTVLLGILLIATIAIIVAIGGWISSEWRALNTAL